jgi:hypothetical protein
MCIVQIEIDTDPGLARPAEEADDVPRGRGRDGRMREDGGGEIRRGERRGGSREPARLPLSKQKRFRAPAVNTAWPPASLSDSETRTRMRGGVCRWEQDLLLCGGVARNGGGKQRGDVAVLDWRTSCSHLDHPRCQHARFGDGHPLRSESHPRRKCRIR